MGPNGRPGAAAAAVKPKATAQEHARAKPSATHAPRDTVLASLLTQMEALQDAHKWVACDSVSQLALARAERQQPADSSAMAQALFSRGNSMFARALFGDSLGPALLTRSIRIYSRMAHPDTAGWVAAHYVLGDALTEADRADSAIVIYAAGRALCRPSVVGADSMRAALWISTGWAERHASRFEGALAAYDSARVIRVRLYGTENPGVAEALADIGALYGRSNRLEEAQVALEQAIGIIERTLGPRSRSMATPLAELANVRYHAGDIAGSIEILERGIGIIVHVNGPDSPRLIPPLYNIALRLSEFGDYAGANAILVGLVPKAEASFGIGNTRTESIRYMAGATAIMMDDTSAAAVHLTRARTELHSKPLDPNHASNGVERYYSILMERRGDRAGARRVVAEGLARELASPQINYDVLVELLSRQLDLSMTSSDSVAVDSTIQLMARYLGDPSTREALVYSDYLRDRARAEAWRGRRDAAWRLALEDEQIARERLLQNVRALPDQSALGLASHSSASLDLLVRLSDHGGEPAIATAWDRVVRWRGLVTAEVAQRRLPRGASADSALAGAHARWVQARRRNAQLEVAHAQGMTASTLPASRTAVGDAERQYAALAAAHGVARDTTTVDLARLRASLQPDQALISLVSISSDSDSMRFVAFATRGPNGALRRIDFATARELSPHIAAWRAALEAPPTRGHESTQEQACRKLGNAVRVITWDRLAPLLTDAHEVVLVADGELADLPWQALPLGSKRYLVDDGPPIQTPGAERDLLANAAAAGHGLLAVGGPEFGAVQAPAPPGDSLLLAPVAAVAAPMNTVAPAGAAATASAATTPTTAVPAGMIALRSMKGDCGSAQSIALAPLPGALAEAQDIARTWDASNPKDPATTLTGAAATEQAFKSDAPGRRVLHIATHGIVWGDGCAPVHEGTRGVGGLEPIAAPATSASASTKGHAGAKNAASAAPKPPASPSPWSGRRVWLALAGANHARAGAADENEGLLTADEVSTLDLSDVDWVVLSACQSGVGQQWPREGSVGMRRAFRLAGAHAVIASQWSIADEPTREWMRALYAARVSDAVPASEATRSASRAMLEARRQSGRSTHPFYWAAFTATGR